MSKRKQGPNTARGAARTHPSSGLSATFSHKGRRRWSRCTSVWMWRDDAASPSPLVGEGARRADEGSLSSARCCVIAPTYPRASTPCDSPPSPAGRALATNVRWGISRVGGVVPWRAAVLSNRPVGYYSFLRGWLSGPAATVPLASPSNSTSVTGEAKVSLTLRSTRVEAIASPVPAHPSTRGRKAGGRSSSPSNEPCLHHFRPITRP